MNDTQRAELKRRMAGEIESLREKIASLEENARPVAPDQSIGRLSRLDNMINQGVSNASLVQSKERLYKLEGAIRQIDEDPHFGECHECGEPIPMARLLAIPEAEFCVECAS